jgi:hypothetical protein
MALDELHARRLATVINVFDDALDRIGLLVEGVGRGDEPINGPRPDPGDLRSLQLAVGRMRERLQAAAGRFELRRTRPPWRQKLAAELSTLWVVLENAMPRRMKGYGREWTPQDRADWEALIRDLLQEIEAMQRSVTPGGSF